MTTKLTAARIATSSGIQVRLADGRDPAVLEALFTGQRVGTIFQPNPRPLPDRKGWLAHALLPLGALRVDAGAERALLRRGASLLAVGIRAVEGNFARQEAVRILSLRDGNWPAASVRSAARSCGASWGFRVRRSVDSWAPVGDAVVHRDQMVLMTETQPEGEPRAMPGCRLSAA